MEDLRISIIIPVYNVEKFLAKCLDSILVGNAFTGQVICVNDGSTDGSAAILEEYAQKYPNIEIITQLNVGLSAARNAGIKAAKGEYICFVDSDDYWEENVLGGLMEQVERDKLDVLRFKYQNVRIKNEGVNELKNEGCLFTEGIYFEDTDWTPRMLVRAKRVASTNTIVYNYFQREGSITKAVNRSKQQKVLEDKMRLIGEMQRQSNELKSKGLNNTWFSRMIADTVISVIGILSVDFYVERKEYLKRLKQMNIYPLATKSAKARLINLSPRLAVELLHLKNS